MPPETRLALYGTDLHRDHGKPVTRFLGGKNGLPLESLGTVPETPGVAIYTNHFAFNNKELW